MSDQVPPPSKEEPSWVPDGGGGGCLCVCAVVAVLLIGAMWR